MTSFELFVAGRYLRARRKEAVISVITVISILGVAAGVMALVIALGVNNGFRSTLQRNLLGAMAHIGVQPRDPTYGIQDWRELVEKIRKVPHVKAVSPTLYDTFFLSGPQSTGALIKGIDVQAELSISDVLKKLKAGSIDALSDPDASPPGLILGSHLAEDTGIKVGQRVKIIVQQGGTTTPFGAFPSFPTFKVVGLFESGFYEVDDHWAFTSIGAVQKMLHVGDAINRIEVNVDNQDRAPEYAKAIEEAVGPKYTTTTWQEQNQQLMSALNMERIVTFITIGLIEIVAALNIFITLVMMVMEKYRDIAVLMSMGARHSQIRRIFMMQGVLIGIVGSVIGLIVGYTLCYYANRYQWVKLPEAVYALPFVPFEPRLVDGVWIGALAVAVSFLATLYPARNATRIAPTEILRYE